MKRARGIIILFTLISSVSMAAPYFPSPERAGLGFEVTRAAVGSKRPQIRVLHAATGEPVPGAEVSFDDATRTLQVSASGFVAMRFHGVPPESDLTIYLRPRTEDAPLVTARGTLTHWQEVPPGNKTQVIGGMVVRALEAWDLIQFDVRGVVSPYRDTINVLGKREIPSNVVLPDQTVSIVFGNVRLNKPEYRLPVYADRPQRLAYAQGTFKVGDVLSSFQSGKLTLDLLNKIKFVRGGLSRELKPVNDFDETLDLSLPLETRLQVQVDKPGFSADVLVMAAQNLKGDRTLLLPTDIKAAYAVVKPELVGKVQLATADANQVNSVAALAISEDEKLLSGVFTEAKSGNLRLGGFLNERAFLRGLRTRDGSVRLRAPARGIGLYVREASSISGPVAMDVVFPSAGEREFVIDPASSEEAALQLDFGAGFDERTCSGTRVLAKLERFQRVRTYKKAQ